LELKGHLEAENIIVLSLNEDNLDASNVREFKQQVAIIIEDRSRVVLDLSAVNFMDSSGLGGLIACQRLMNSRKGEFRLCSLNDRVRALFELMRMQRVFTIHKTREDALQSFP
jgi:anti-sigma B factor antagonist